MALLKAMTESLAGSSEAHGGVLGFHVIMALEFFCPRHRTPSVSPWRPVAGLMHRTVKHLPQARSRTRLEGLRLERTLFRLRLHMMIMVLCFVPNSDSLFVRSAHLIFP